MNRPLLIIILICFNSINYAFAQWTNKDSLWLQNILSGKEKLELNPEALKAIQSGNLINLDNPASHMKLVNPDETLPITKDFSEYIKHDSVKRKMALKDLPPLVFRKYGPKKQDIVPVLQSIMDELKRDPLQGGGGGITFSIADMTSKKGHVHNHNAKRDGTWKEYNNLPTPDIIKKKKKFDETLAVKLKKDSVPASFKDSMCFINPDTVFPKPNLLPTLIGKQQ